MTTSAATERRELAHRTGNGIEVRLLWTKPTNSVAIVVVDTYSGAVISPTTEPNSLSPVAPVR